MWSCVEIDGGVKRIESPLNGEERFSGDSVDSDIGRPFDPVFHRERRLCGPAIQTNHTVFTLWGSGMLKEIKTSMLSHSARGWQQSKVKKKESRKVSITIDGTKQATGVQYTGTYGSYLTHSNAKIVNIHKKGLLNEARIWYQFHDDESAVPAEFAECSTIVTFIFLIRTTSTNRERRMDSGGGMGTLRRSLTPLRHFLGCHRRQSKPRNKFSFFQSNGSSPFLF